MERQKNLFNGCAVETLNNKTHENTDKISPCSVQTENDIEESIYSPQWFPCNNLKKDLQHLGIKQLGVQKDCFVLMLCVKEDAESIYQ